MLQEALEVFQVCIKSRHGHKYDSLVLELCIRDRKLSIYVHTMSTHFYRFPEFNHVTLTSHLGSTC